MKITKRHGVITTLLLAPFVLYAADSRAASRRSAAPVTFETAPPLSPSPVLTAWSNAAAAVAKVVRPSVVFIRAAEKDSSPVTAEGIPEPFRQFFQPFGDDSGNFQFFFHGPATHGRPRVREAAGSGFIISPDGYIVTNAHVVRGADQVDVRLFDGRQFSARLVGQDPATDVAVVKIDGHHLPVAAVGNSDSSQVGDWVLAIGNPMGEALTFTVTSGIVSAKGRLLPDLPTTSKYGIQDFIQTDAAINPGNSGGPLVNTSGQVIGINSAIASETGAYEGYGFAIPINLARPVIDELIKSGKVDRAMLGISIRQVDADDAAWAKLDSVQGVVVQGFTSDASPARNSGLEPGDVIVALDGHPVTYVSQFQQAITFRKPGDVVTLTVQRKGGDQETVHVTLGRLPSTRAGATVSPASAGDAPYGRRLGITVQPATAGEEEERGLLVTSVDPEGPASGKLAPRGSPQGPDIITRVDGTRVRALDDLSSALSKDKGGDVVSIETYNEALKATRVIRLRLR